jgi:hypothetical protein
MSDEIAAVIAAAKAWSAEAHSEMEQLSSEAEQTRDYSRLDEAAVDHGKSAWELLDRLLAALEKAPAPDVHEIHHFPTIDAAAASLAEPHQ